MHITAINENYHELESELISTHRRVWREKSKVVIVYYILKKKGFFCRDYDILREIILFP